MARFEKQGPAGVDLGPGILRSQLNLPKTDAELIQWLRDHSSGVYRASALAADRLEELRAREAQLVNKLDETEHLLRELLKYHAVQNEDWKTVLAQQADEILYLVRDGVDYGARD